jgi:hypothetical protein
MKEIRVGSTLLELSPDARVVIVTTPRSDDRDWDAIVAVLAEHGVPVGYMDIDDATSQELYGSLADVEKTILRWPGPQEADYSDPKAFSSPFPESDYEVLSDGTTVEADRASHLTIVDTPLSVPSSAREASRLEALALVERTLRWPARDACLATEVTVSGGYEHVEYFYVTVRLIGTNVPSLSDPPARCR